MKDKERILSDLKILIKYTKKYLSSAETSDNEKGLIILTAYAAANSFYEKFSTIMIKEIKENFTKDLRKNSKKFFLLKYRNGKKLQNLGEEEIIKFLKNIKQETFHSEFNSTHKSLNNISELFNLLQINKNKEIVLEKILLKKKLDLDGFKEQLKLSYTSDRTAIIHGEYKDIKTLFLIYRDKYLVFLINIYLAMKIMLNSHPL